MVKFNQYLVVLTILGSVHRGIGDTWSPSNILNYFKAANVNSVDAVLCSNADNWRMMRFWSKEANTNKFRGLLRVVLQLYDDILYQEGRLGIFIDVSCSNNRKLLSNKTCDWFSQKFTWLIWDIDGWTNNVSLPLSSISHVFKMKQIEIIRLYKVTNTVSAAEYKEGTWDPKTGKLSLTPANIIINLNQSIIRGSILFTQDIYDRSHLFEQLQDWTFAPGQDLGNRMLFSYIQHTAQLFNFHLQLKISTDWGEKLENGSWVGMLGQLKNQNAEIIITPMSLSKQRMEIAYPLISAVPYKTVAVFMQPRALGTYRALILELTPSAWIVYGLISILVAISFALSQKYCKDTASDYWVSLGILQTIGVVANQGAKPQVFQWNYRHFLRKQIQPLDLVIHVPVNSLSYTPQSASSRILCVSWLVVCLLVSTYYGAGTVTALLSESQPSLTSLKQLLESGITLAPPELPFKYDPEVQHQMFLKPVVEKIKNSKLHTLDEGVCAIKNGSAFMGEYFVVFEGINRRMESNTICDLTALNVGPKVNMANHVRKHPHLREIFMRGILRSMEHGLVNNERQHWLTEKLLCSQVIEFIEIKLESVSIAFLIFFGGVLLSATIFCLEIYLRGRQKEKIGTQRAPLLHFPM